MDEQNPPQVTDEQVVTEGGVGNLDALSGSQPVQPTPTAAGVPVTPVTTDPDQVKEPETPGTDATSDVAPDAAPVDNVGETEPVPAPSQQQADQQPNL